MGEGLMPSIPRCRKLVHPHKDVLASELGVAGEQRVRRLLLVEEHREGE